MPPAPVPANDMQRVAALQTYEGLDAACDRALVDIAELAARLTGTPTAFVSMLDEHEQRLTARFGIDMSQTPRDQAFCGYTILDDEPLVVPDAAMDARFADNPLVLEDPAIRFYAGVPLVNIEGFALGALCVIDSTPRDLTPEQRSTLTVLARSVMTTLELQRAMKAMRAMALTNPLTGIGNRAAMIDHAERAMARQHRSGEAFALLIIDLDGFKALNDTAGHQTGDRALVEVARTLLHGVRREDMVARLGGDEFTVLLERCSAAHLDATAKRLGAAIGGSMRAQGWPVTASIGGAHFSNPPRDVDTAMRLADQAMYAAKRAGRDTVSITSDAAPACADAAH